MRRREFLAVVGGATAWPIAASAQHTIPLIGFLDSRSPDGMASRLGGFRQGLKEVGFSEGQNLKIEYRWAENNIDRLPEMAAELVSRQVAAIITTGGPATALAAKAATSAIPIIFLVGEDPTRLGLVSSLTRPTGNLTGINLFSNEIEAKRLELLHQVVPQAARIAVLVNSNDQWNTENTLRDVEVAARSFGLQIQVLRASTAREIAEAFASMVERPDALFVGAAAFLNARRVQVAQLAAFHRLPASYALREAAEVGGLMTYGPSIVDAYRQWGAYAGQVLKGTKPADLPVIQASKFELVFNLTTARLLGLEIPANVLARADEVVE